MPLGTKGNSLIVKDGKLAENCGCCAYCVVFKSEGWSGYINNEDTGTIYGNPINGDGWGDGLATSGGLQRPYVIAVWPNRRIKLSFTIGLSAIQAKIEASSSGNGITFDGGEVTLETANVEQFLNGDIVEISSVVSNTISLSKDEYDKDAFSQIGKFYIRKAQLSECGCSCEPNYFAPSQPITTPNTYTLQFTKSDARPNGPRWPKPATPYYGGFGQYAIGKYAGFMPPNDVREYFTPFDVRGGCDSYLERILQPIVLRKVQGTNHTYLSDPINIKPCAQVRYRFDACPGLILSGFDYHIAPALSAYSVQSAGWTQHPSARIYADAPLCVWNSQQYRQTPAGYQSAKDLHVYAFGDFATVTPGGTYQPEPQLLCGGAQADLLSLAEGCFGNKCPPSEIQVTIEGGSEQWTSGTYSIPRSSAFCLSSAGTFLPDNYFAGFRGTYSQTFNLQRQLTISIFRQASGGFQWSVSDRCGCDGRTVGLFVSWQGFGGGFDGSASTNATRIPDVNECVPICADAGTESVFNNVTLQTRSINGSGFTSIGKVTVRF
jgi:hypothetical protein